MQDLVIKNRRTSEQDGRYRIHFDIVNGHDSELWFDVPSEYKHWVTDSYDPAVVGLLLPAMVSGQTLRVEGPVSTHLVWFLTRTVIPIMSVVQKKARPVDIVGFTPASVSEPPANAVAMGLSNGLDSTIAVDEYGPHGSAPPELKITHVIFNDVGAAGRYGQKRTHELSDQRLQNTVEAARGLGLPLITMFSNVDGLQGELVHIDNHVLKNATTPLLLQRGIRTFLYAADVEWAEMKVNTDNMSYTDPMLIPGLSTENVSMLSVNAEYDRVQKTKLAADLSLAQNHLNICTRSYPNCSTCDKCMRTIIVLEAAGALEQFASRFDLDKYRKFKTRYAVWARFDSYNQSRLGAALYRPAGAKQTAEYYSLLVLNRLDRLIQYMPGYRQLAGQGFVGRLRRSLLYKI